MRVGESGKAARQGTEIPLEAGGAGAAGGGKVKEALSWVKHSRNWGV